MQSLSLRVPFIRLQTNDGEVVIHLVTKKMPDGNFLVQLKLGPRIIATLGITATPNLLRPVAMKAGRFLNKYLTKYLRQLMVDSNILPFDPNRDTQAPAEEIGGEETV